MNLEGNVPVALALTIGLGATVAAAILLTTWWWRGEPDNGSSVGGSKKALAHSPGVRVRRIQKDSSSEGSNGGWSRSSSSSNEGEAGGRGKSASKWEQSKQKGDLGYYFAHHITMKELAPEDYRMNGPRLLSKGDAAAPLNGAQPSNDVSSAPASASSSPSPPRPATNQRRRRPQQISSYSWEDYGEEVRLTFRQPEWESWAKVDAEEIFVEWDPRRFRMSIDSREYGLHLIDLPRLSGELADVRVKKLKSRLVVALVKAGQRRGSYSKQAAWTSLQAAPEKPAD